MENNLYSWDWLLTLAIYNSFNIDTHTYDLSDMYALTLGLKAYITAKSQVSMLQLMCSIFLWQTEKPKIRDLQIPL